MNIFNKTIPLFKKKEVSEVGDLHNRYNPGIVSEYSITIPYPRIDRLISLFLLLITSYKIDI